MFVALLFIFVVRKKCGKLTKETDRLSLFISIIIIMRKLCMLVVVTVCEFLKLLITTDFFLNEKQNVVRDKGL